MTASEINNQEFLTLGTHCSDPLCHQLDFLPFKCPSCSLPFCADHWRPPQGHTCAKFDPLQADNRIPSCPLCSQPVSFPVGQDPNVSMDRHLTSSCPALAKLSATDSTPTSSGTSTPVHSHLQQQKLGGHVCAERRCTTKLIAPITCSACRLKYCPKHRFDKDHDCLKQQQLQRQKTETNSGGGASGGFFSKLKPATQTTPTRSTTSNNTGLAALRRAQAAVSSKLDSLGPNQTHLATHTQQQPVRVASASSQTVLDTTTKSGTDNDKKRDAKPTGVRKATVGLVGSKTDKRALAEQASAKKALEARAKRGLLTEDEKVKYATLQALEAKNGTLSSSSRDGCVVC
ncbi:hypothetical protein OIV83_004203 [Microbotryomycetes sp. JL201]|nr:hypothetical protein OIV83_004203 [Microbotryomycetes sp. JL201]